MLICKNNKTKKYTGKENTPLGKGFHASGYKEGKRMKGKDGNFYKAKGKRWQRIKKENKRTNRGIGYSDLSVEDKEQMIRAQEEHRRINEMKLDESNDLCDFLIKSLASADYTPRDFLQEIMKKVVEEDLGLNCSEENKNELIRRLTAQYNDEKSALFGIRKILKSVEVYK